MQNSRFQKFDFRKFLCDDIKYNGLKIKSVFFSGRRASATPKVTGAIPKPRSGRRHSVQVSSLSKDIEKLRLGEKKEGESKNVDKDAQPPGSGMSESRKKELRRMSSKRRSSKQGQIIQGIYSIIVILFITGFLHFLDLAIAN